MRLAWELVMRLVLIWQTVRGSFGETWESFWRIEGSQWRNVVSCWGNLVSFWGKAQACPRETQEVLEDKSMTASGEIGDRKVRRRLRNEAGGDLGEGP